MWEHLFKIAFVSVYVAILLTVAFYGFHRYVLVYLYIKHKNNAYRPKAKWTELPRVTVQLPMYNEDLCAERIIEATCQIDYPLDKLDIQVLDDSSVLFVAVFVLASVVVLVVLGFPVLFFL